MQAEKRVRFAEGVRAAYDGYVAHHAESLKDASPPGAEPKILAYLGSVEYFVREARAELAVHF